MTLDNDALTKIKDKAEKYFLKGNFKDAFKTYDEIRTYGKKDPRILIRIAEIARKMEDTKAAVAAYKEAADAFTKLGFIIKAIAVSKIIIQIDPSDKETQKRLAESYAESTHPGGSEIPPPAAAPARPAAPAAAPAPKQEIKREFPRTPLFSDFTREELTDVVNKVKFRSFKKDDDVIKSGDEGSSIFMIVQGTLAVIAKDFSGNEMTVATLDKDSAFFGEFGFFSNAKRKNTVRALEDLELLELTRADLDAIIAARPRVSQVLFDFYKERVVENLLARSPIFNVVNEKDRKSYLKELELRKFHNGDYVCKQGEKGDEMFLIKSGHVGVWIQEGSNKKTLGELSEGDFIGEIALATSKPRIANVTAIGEVEVLTFTRNILKSMLETYPAIRTAFEGLIKERVTEAMKAKQDASAMI
ncbi:MAG: cyclic nucleotide-binding domain-containing protein [Deltaproteobacteria bacterium]|nr:cyclic nucleotide-binding domain-containing protein [Deltaproteobacteria bacterium]